MHSRTNFWLCYTLLSKFFYGVGVTIVIFLCTVVYTVSIKTKVFEEKTLYRYSRAKSLTLPNRMVLPMMNARKEAHVVQLHLNRTENLSKKVVTTIERKLRNEPIQKTWIKAPTDVYNVWKEKPRLGVVHKWCYVL